MYRNTPPWPAAMGLLQNAAAQRREKNEKRKEKVFSYEND